MKSRLLLIFFVLSIAVNISAGAVFGWKYILEKKNLQSGTWREMMSGCPCMDGIPDLSVERRQHLGILKSKLREERLKTRQKIMEYREKIFEELRRDDFDLENIYKIVDEISKIQNEFQKLVIKEVMNERKNLSPEQRQSFDKFIGDRITGKCRCKRWWE